MPTILRIAGVRGVLYPNDHRPAHVHVIGKGEEAVYELNCPKGLPTLWENYGFAEREINAVQRTLEKYIGRLFRPARRYMVKHEEFSVANESARDLQARVPRAVSAKYDRRIRRIVVQLSSNLGIFFSPRDAEGLEHASPEELAEIEISPSGFGLHFPKLDADLYLPALLEGIFGSEPWTASRMGALGGSVRSAAKTMAARENGKKGGRPKLKGNAYV